MIIMPNEITSEIHQLRSRVDALLLAHRDTIYAAVHSCLCDVLQLPPTAISSDSSLVLDLGVTSLEMVQITGSIESVCGVLIDVNRIEELVVTKHGQRDSDAALDKDELSRLVAMMPEVRDLTVFKGCRRQDIIPLFSVETLVRLVALNRSSS